MILKKVNMKRILIATALCFGLLSFTIPTHALFFSAELSPSSQTGYVGEAVDYTGSWSGGSGTYEVTLDCEDGSTHYTTTSSTSETLHCYFESTGTKNVTLTVYNPDTNQIASDTASVYVR